MIGLIMVTPLLYTIIQTTARFFYKVFYKYLIKYFFDVLLF